LFDIFNSVFLILAIVIFIMLRNVLGRRTGDERPPMDPYAQHDKINNENVVSLPGASRRRPGDDPLDKNNLHDEIEWEKFVKPDFPAIIGLKKIAAADHTYNPEEFLHGAKIAYEVIVKAFSNGDRETLRNLLKKSAYDGFEAVIGIREERGERVESNLVGISAADFVDATLKDDTAQIAVRFKSQLISVTFNRDGNLIDGDETVVRDVTELWTFERVVSSSNPNWVLAATETAQ